MSPDFEAALEPHWRTDCSDSGATFYVRWVRCRCGWESEPSGTLVHIPDMHRVWNAHLAAVLRAEVAAWLGSEEVREAVEFGKTWRCHGCLRAIARCTCG